MRVQIYKNLRRGDWSLRAQGKVIDHKASCALANVTFVVRESSRLRVVAKHCREVHAWCEGELLPDGAAPAGELIGVTYNPFRGGAFTRRDNGAAVTRAAFVWFAVDGKAYAIQPQ